MHALLYAFVCYTICRFGYQIDLHCRKQEQFNSRFNLSVCLANPAGLHINPHRRIRLSLAAL